MKITITAATPHAVLAEVERHYAKEGPRLRRLAGLTAGAEKKQREAQALYADQQWAFWANVDIEEPSDLSWSLVASRLTDALQLILPLAKGYAPEGQTPEARRTCRSWIEAAEAAIAEAEAFIKKDPA